MWNFSKWLEEGGACPDVLCGTGLLLWLYLCEFGPGGNHNESEEEIIPLLPLNVCFHLAKAVLKEKSGRLLDLVKNWFWLMI